MTGKWLSVIGIGDDGLDGLSPRARRALDAAHTVFGGKRHLAMLDEPAKGVAWRSPIEASLAEIGAARPGPVAVLASGDPSWFGIAKLLQAHFGAGEIDILPSPSAFSLAAARLGWALEDVNCLSICGRPLDDVWPHLRPGERLIILSAGARSPAELAEGLARRGYGPSRLSVLEHLGGRQERVREARADDFMLRDVTALNLVAVTCEPAPGAAHHARVPGLPDEAFATDGTMTKRTLRALAISSLAPMPGELLWDIGSGSGSISIEWLRAAPATRAIAIEPREERRALIAENAMRLCVAGLDIRAGRAPEALLDLPSPDAVFIGGGLSEIVVNAAVAALAPGGRLVAHGVTIETQSLLAACHEIRGGEMIRISVETAEPLGRFRGWRSAMPVVHWHWTKTGIA